MVYLINLIKKEKELLPENLAKKKLIKRTDHLIQFNKKTEEKVKNALNKLKELSEKIKQNPKDIKSRYRRASIRKYLENNTLALNDFKIIEKKTLKIQKTKQLPEKLLGSLYDNLATIYSRYEMKNHTIHYKLKAIKASPKESRLYNNLGGYLAKIKSYHLGIQYLNEAIKMIPTHSFANWGLSIAYSDLEQYQKAMDHVNIAFENEENLYKRGTGNSERDLRTIRGFLYHKLGHSEKGIEDLEEALDINKNNSFALKNLGIIYHDLGNYDKACELLKKSKELGYEKIFDRNDLKESLAFSCGNKTSTNGLKISDQPIYIQIP